MAYIYKIENQINHKIYIGKTNYTNPQKRWKQHQADSKKDSCNHRALYRALNKYGVENFSFEIIEETQNPEEREKYYIALYNTYHNGYNETLGGDGASYLNLPEQDICKFYLKPHTLIETSQYFNHDIETIKQILYKYNIQIVSGQEINKQKFSLPVAKLNKKTGEIIEIYSSISEAERNNNCHTHIKDVCHGKRISAGGYRWKFIT